MISITKIPKVYRERERRHGFDTKRIKTGGAGT